MAMPVTSSFSDEEELDLIDLDAPSAQGSPERSVANSRNESPRRSAVPGPSPSPSPSGRRFAKPPANLVAPLSYESDDDGIDELYTLEDAPVGPASPSPAVTTSSPANRQSAWGVATAADAVQTGGRAASGMAAEAAPHQGRPRRPLKVALFQMVVKCCCLRNAKATGSHFAFKLGVVAVMKLVDATVMDAYRTFTKFDTDSDGYVTRQDLYQGLKELGLGLSPHVFRQYIDTIFQFADLDTDDRLNFSEYYSMHEKQHQARMKFERHDTDGDGLINKAAFEQIVHDLRLTLDEHMYKSYIDMNFRFADRNFRGTLSLGQYLACYATLLVMHAKTNTANSSSHNSTAVAAAAAPSPAHRRHRRGALFVRMVSRKGPLA